MKSNALLTLAVVTAALGVGPGCINLPPRYTIRAELAPREMAERLHSRFAPGMERDRAGVVARECGMLPLPGEDRRMSMQDAKEPTVFAARDVYEIRFGGRVLVLIPMIYDMFPYSRYMSLLFDEHDKVIGWRVWSTRSDGKKSAEILSGTDPASLGREPRT